MYNRRRMRGLFKTEEEESTEPIDFSSAALYLAGAQVLIAVGAGAVTSVLSCWLLPAAAVSAVRTLTLTSVVGAFLVLRPVRIAKVHGLAVVFASLRPAVPLYLGCLVLEQLVHTCSTDASQSPSWRRVVFVFAVLVMLFAGFVRASNPLEPTDVPFLLVASSLIVVALLPPPAVALAGPLCEPPSLLSAAERIVRSISFSSVFIVFVFCSTSPSANANETTVTVARAFAASVWTLGAPSILLFLSIPQCVFAVVSRLKINTPSSNYDAVDTVSPPPELESGSVRNRPLSSTPPKQHSPTMSDASTTRAVSIGQLSLRDIGGGGLNFAGIVPEERRPGMISKAEMERLADSIQ